VGSIEVGPVDIWTVAFSPDDKFIISGSHSGKIALYGVESGKQEQTLDTRGKFTLSIAYVSRGFFRIKHLHMKCDMHLDVCVVTDVLSHGCALTLITFIVYSHLTGSILTHNLCVISCH